MILRLIRIYTPFILAIAALIHGVLYFNDYNGIIYRLLGELTGHSLFVNLYMIASSEKMCKWYKMTIYFLLSIHIIGLFYYCGFIKDIMVVMYLTMVMNIFAVIFFLIYRVTRGITKILC